MHHMAVNDVRTKCSDQTPNFGNGSKEPSYRFGDTYSNYLYFGRYWFNKRWPKKINNHYLRPSLSETIGEIHNLPFGPPHS